MKPGLIGSLMAIVLAPGVAMVSKYESGTESRHEQLASSMQDMSYVLASFQADNASSRSATTKQMEALASVVEGLNKAHADEIAELRSMVAEVRNVAMQPTPKADTSAFENLLQDFQNSITTKTDKLVADVEQKLEATKSLSTLDPASVPEGDNYPTDFQDMAERLVALEKVITKLESRSAPAVASSPVYYEGATYSGNCTGSAPASYGSTGSTAYASYPTYQAASYQAYQSAPQVTGYTRSGLFGRRSTPSYSGYSSGQTCRIVNGVQVCN